VIRPFPEQVFVAQRGVENALDTRALDPQFGAIEALAETRLKGAEHLWAMQVDPLPIERLGQFFTRL